MYSTTLRLREYLVIGVVFSLLLAAFCLTQQVWAQVYTDTRDPNFKYYFNDGLKIYIDFPANWTPTEQPNGISLAGNGAGLIISVYSPTSGSYFPSSNTPTQQIAKGIYDRVSNLPNFQLLYNTIYVNSPFPSQQLSYAHDVEGVGRIITERNLSIHQGNLYDVRYSVKESLFDQYTPIKDSMLSSTAFGDYYDNVKAQLQAIKTAGDDARTKIGNTVKAFGDEQGNIARQTIIDGIGSIADGDCEREGHFLKC